MALIVASETPIFHALAMEIMQAEEETEALRMVRQRMDDASIADVIATGPIAQLAIESGPIEGTLVESSVQTAPIVTGWDRWKNERSSE
jgi:hypothetical protein